MADEADIANDRIERDTNAALMEASSRVAGDGSDECESCGEPIPAARRQAAPWARLCIECQTEAEELRR